jgi:transcriptional regulator with XRE-family HTH domain
MPRKREKGPYKYELVGARLREWRESIGLSLEVLATRVGYSVSGYKKIERGEHKASPELLQKLHDLFGVGPETFLISAERSALVGADEWGTVLRRLSEADVRRPLSARRRRVDARKGKRAQDGDDVF